MTLRAQAFIATIGSDSRPIEYLVNDVGYLKSVSLLDHTIEDYRKYLDPSMYFQPRIRNASKRKVGCEDEENHSAFSGAFFDMSMGYSRNVCQYL